MTVATDLTAAGDVCGIQTIRSTRLWRKRHRAVLARVTENTMNLSTYRKVCARANTTSVCTDFPSQHLPGKHPAKQITMVTATVQCARTRTHTHTHTHIHKSHAHTHTPLLPRAMLDLPPANSNADELFCSLPEGNFSLGSGYESDNSSMSFHSTVESHFAAIEVCVSPGLLSQRRQLMT